jgi:hypothetical protein
VNEEHEGEQRCRRRVNTGSGSDPYFELPTAAGFAVLAGLAMGGTLLGGNVTSVILIDGRAAGVWDLIARPSPEFRLFFLAPPDPQTRRAIHAQAAELAGTLTDGSAQVVECDHMTPLTQATTGSFLFPLRDPR